MLPIEDTERERRCDGRVEHDGGVEYSSALVIATSTESTLIPSVPARDVVRLRRLADAEECERSRGLLAAAGTERCE